MNKSKTTKIFLGCGGLFFAYACYVLIRMTDRVASWQAVAAAVGAVGVIACTWGFWQAKLWALRLSFVLALSAVGLGAYLAHFAWTFWLFEEPTLMDRIQSVLQVRIVIFFFFPMTWLSYFNNPAIRQQFTWR